MNETKKNNRPLILSIITLMICIALLIGATLAWFTDTETNTGNRIQAGTLDVVVYKYTGSDATPTKDLETGWEQITEDTASDFIFDFDFENWEPSDSETIYLAVENAGSLAVDYSIDLVVSDEKLADALQFTCNSEIATVPTALTSGFVTVSSVIEDDMIPATTSGKLGVDDGVDDVEYIALTVNLDDSTGNYYQDFAFDMDFILTATQQGKMSEVVNAYTIDDIKNAKSNQTVILMQDIRSTENVELTTNVNFDLNGYTLTVGSFSMVTDDYCTVDIADGNIVASSGNITIDIKNGTLNLVNFNTYTSTSGTSYYTVSPYTVTNTGYVGYYKISDTMIEQIVSGEATVEEAKADSATTVGDVELNGGINYIVNNDSKVTGNVSKEENGEDFNIEQNDNGTIVGTVTGAVLDEDVTKVSTAGELLVAVIGKEEIVLANDLTIDTGSIYKYGDNYYYLVTFLQSFGMDIDLNGYTLTVESDYSIAVYENKPFTIKNGILEIDYLTGANSATGMFVTYENAVLTLENVNYSTNGAGVLVSGPNATVNVIDSTITTPYYCLATNATATDGVVASKGLEMNYSGSTFTTTVEGGIPVFLNVPGVLNMDDCTVNSADTGVLVRGGTAYISDTVINSTYNYDIDAEGGYFFLDGNWGSGTGVPFAGIVLGNRGGSSYMYDTECTLDNVTVNLYGSASDYAVYVWGHSGTDSIEGDDITLDFAYTNSAFDGDIYVAGSNVTINGSALTNLPTDEAVVYEEGKTDYTTTAVTNAFSLYASSFATATTQVPTATSVEVNEVVTYIEGASVSK